MEAAFQAEADTYPLRNSVILNSSTTLYIFNNLNRFINYTPALPRDFIWAGNAKAPVVGYGQVDIKVKGPRGRSIIRLYDVAYVPSMLYSLVSLRHLRKRGL